MNDGCSPAWATEHDPYLKEKKKKEKGNIKSSLNLRRDVHPYLYKKYTLKYIEAIFSPYGLAKIEKFDQCEETGTLIYG